MLQPNQMEMHRREEDCDRACKCDPSDGDEQARWPKFGMRAGGRIGVCAKEWKSGGSASVYGLAGAMGSKMGGASDSPTGAAYESKAE